MVVLLGIGLELPGLFNGALITETIFSWPGMGRLFFNAIDRSDYAVMMGVGTILEARKILMLASGSSKATAVAGAIEGPVTSMNTASALQLHREVVCFLDRPAASKLTMTEYYEWIQAKQATAPGVVKAPHFLEKALRGESRNTR